MRIKHANWFAAGPEVQGALSLLSDGAFKLYFYLCINASRETGLISASYLQVASALGKSRRSMATYFAELRRHGVCRMHAGLNQYQCGEIMPHESGQYLARIKALLSARVCIRCAFTAADRRYAEQLAEHSIPFIQIERAIALGCSRKYVSLLNGADNGLILSLRYFSDLIEEAGAEGTPAGYWDYLMPQLKRLEAEWVAVEKSGDAKNASAKSGKTEKTR